MKFSKEDISTLFSRLIKYLDNFTCLLLYFTPWVGITAWGFMLFDRAFEAIPIPYKLGNIILRILASIIPIIPTLQIWNGRDEFDGEKGVTSGIMDCCFTIWVLVLICVWSLH